MIKGTDFRKPEARSEVPFWGVGLGGWLGADCDEHLQPRWPHFTC